MATTAPRSDLDTKFSSPGATPKPWEDTAGLLAAAELYWLTTVRVDGRPHVTPLIGVWLDGAVHFCTGQDEQKARNLAANPACAITTGRNDWNQGVDTVVEGTVEQVTDDARLHQLADAWVAKYGEEWRFDVRDGAFHSDEGGRALVFAVAPTRAFAFGKGEPFSQTTYRF
jgi:PPOX class probable F420-dependent enzyme